MKVLITGSKGQVGLCLVNMLSWQRDVEVYAYDRDQFDITNEIDLQAKVSALRPVYAAAHTAVDRAEQEVDKSYAIKRDGSMHLAKSADKLGALLLHISTDYIFDGNSSASYVE